MNTFMNGLANNTNVMVTENGSIAHKSTLSGVYDLFALGGAYRNRSDEDAITLFIKALDENEELAMKCLFYLRDVRGGQGERRFFRVVFNWLANNRPEIAKRNIGNVAEYGRWDDLIYTLLDTPLEKDMMYYVQAQLSIDLDSCAIGCAVSLLGKWMPSENASSKVTKAAGKKMRIGLGYTAKQYRQILSALRKQLNIVERLMSENRWDEIEFDKIPSRAGLIYKNAFARRDMIAKKYEEFVKDEKTTINADTLYPYDIVRDIRKDAGAGYWGGFNNPLTDVQIAAFEKMWNNLPDYFEGQEKSMICVVDTSGSMTSAYHQNVAPIDVAISLGLYCAERNKGDFANKYISFASRPQLIDTRGANIADKIERIYKTNLVDDTNLEATFNLLLNVAKTSNPTDVPDTVLIISDMQINQGVTIGDYWDSNINEKIKTLMERMRDKWAAAGIKMPNLVYWNVNASHDTILDLGPNVTCVGGASPITFQMVMSGKTGIEVMLDKLQSPRYDSVH